MQSWSLERKIQVTQTRIIEWYLKFDGQVFVAFSGGKDSTVLLDIARKIYPNIEVIFVDTGLEYPEIRDFVKTISDVIWIKPEMNFKKVIENYGYPVISKEVSRDIAVARRKPNGKTADRFDPNSEYCKKYGERWCLEKWNFLKNSNIPISNQCCNIMKKKPIQKYIKELNKQQIIGTMASESALRKQNWLKNGCNAFNQKRPSSQPMSFWTEQDVLQYIKQFNIPYSSIYGDIVEDKSSLVTTGVNRTGCMFCMFGCHLEKEPNRFQRMKITHPKLYDYCIREENGLGLGKVLDYIGVKY
jgi:3'-phosphoadenosine 5'-phosphosulfate sulfotransferase (PAPS reductase)/FAD synthetase